jgi:hypothetical protein
MGANSVWQSFNLGARNLLTPFKTTLCDECSRPVRFWSRRVWVVDGKRCAHLQCWSGQIFVKGYVHVMAEEIRNKRRSQSAHNDSTEPELRELRVSAQALRERAERLEQELLRAGEVATVARSTGRQ